MNTSTFKEKYFTNDIRSIKARKNVFESFILKGGSIIIGFILVSSTIKYLDPKTYGIWLTLSSVLAWFSFFDIGFGHGLRNKFAEAIAHGNHQLARKYVSTTYASLIIIFLTAWLSFMIINKYLNWSKILNTSPNQENMLSKVALIVFTFFCIQFVVNLISTVLTASQQSAKSGIFNFISNLIILISILILSKVEKSGSLKMLALITGISQCLVLILASIWFYTKGLKRYSPSIKMIDFTYLNSLMGLGVKFFIIQIAGVLIFQSTNIVITQLLGAEQVTVYNVAYKYFSSANMLLGIIITPYWSAITEAYVKEDFEWINRIMNDLNKLWYAFVILIILMLCVSNFVFNIWVGKLVNIPIKVSILLAITMMLTTKYSIYIILINGIGKIKLQLIANILVAIIYLPLSIYLGKSFGINGIILASLLVSLLYAILAPIQGKKLMFKKANGIWNE